MDKKAVEKQYARLDSLEQEIKEIRTRAKRTSQHARTDVFRDALLGEQDFLKPAETREEYLSRVGFYERESHASLDELRGQAAKLPPVRAQLWDRRRDIRIGIIADRFLFESLEDAANFIPLTPGNYKSEVPKLDLVFIVSTWKGLAGEWEGINSDTETRAALTDGLIKLARARSVPVAFYSKEDPPNFETFISLAALADFVFTSAEEMVPKYRERLGTDVPVEVLRFGVNYRRHNPIGSERHEGREMVFAGSWFRNKYKHRSAAGLKILDGIKASNADLIIFDRNLDLNPEHFSDLLKYQFPDKYTKNIRPPLDHDELLKLQRLLPFGINLNSVIGSQTMFANRVVELLAMGSVILSNYSSGVNSLYPYVTIIDSPVDATQFVDDIPADYVKYCRAEGIRDVFLNDTAFDRVDQILGAVGLLHNRTKHRILVVCDQKDDFEAFKSSQCSDFNLEWRTPSQLQYEVGSEFGDMVVFPGRIGLTGPDLVADSVAAFRYSSPDFIRIVGYDDETQAYEISEGKVAEAHVVWLPVGKQMSDLEHGASLLVRSSAFATSKEPKPYSEPEISVIVPVYNNGRYLLHKCFQSLLRSSIFSRAEIILVDDGSTDLKTKHVLHLLDTKYGNVRVYEFPEGGSGSASRPRNKGLEMASAPFVTYLDPDNEQINDAYAELLRLVKRDDSDFAIGNMIKFKGYRRLVNNSGALEKALDVTGANTNGLGRYQLTGANQDLLRNLVYQPMSIQALVAKTSWLRSLDITQPVGAVGQDSYFFQQMLYYARSISVSEVAAHVYYAEVLSSTVNTVSPRFYRKYIPLEKSRSAWLAEIGLHKHYSETRFIRFLRGWYLDKLKQVAPGDRLESLNVIHEIARIYGDEVLSNAEYREAMSGAFMDAIES